MLVGKGCHNIIIQVIELHSKTDEVTYTYRVCGPHPSLVYVESTSMKMSRKQLVASYQPFGKLEKLVLFGEV